MSENYYLEKFITKSKQYKIPLVFASIGIILFVCAVILMIQSRQGGEVVFENEATISAKTKIKVDIAGAVVNPGVYEFAEGSRIAEGLSAAGGLAEDADRSWIAKYLNQAAKLVDGGKLYIPSVNEANDTDKNRNVSDVNGTSNINNKNEILGVSEGKINVNTASLSELDTLPGVGEVTANKIIAGRPYQTLEELKSKKAVGNALFEKIKELITVY
jgi:competence protein ComEA